MLPTMIFSGGCLGLIPDPFDKNDPQKLTNNKKYYLGAIIFDGGATITLLVVGILGGLSIIPAMPLLLNCAFIFLAVTSISLWIAAIVDTKGEILQFSKKLFI